MVNIWNTYSKLCGKAKKTFYYHLIKCIAANIHPAVFLKKIKQCQIWHVQTFFLHTENDIDDKSLNATSLQIYMLYFNFKCFYITNIITFNNQRLLLLCAEKIH